MKKILITYGTSDFKETLRRLKKEAKGLKMFDKIIVYGPKDLPDYINSNPLMAFKKGGGYWLWKPYIIWKTLHEYEDSVVIYVDGGCSLNVTDDWNVYFDNIEKYNTIVFNYRNDFDYGWNQLFNCSSPEIQHWTKQKTLSYFDSLFETDNWRHFNKIWGGFIICKEKNNCFINEWLSVSLLYSELVCDPFGNELNNQESTFVQHRHDQSIITPLAYFFAQKNEVLIVPEKSESESAVAAVGATRIKLVIKVSAKTKLIRIIKALIGENVYTLLHSLK
jgi:hypothetical protein